MNCVTRRFIDRARDNNYLSPGIVDAVFKSTPDSCPLRRIVAEEAVFAVKVIKLCSWDSFQRMMSSVPSFFSEVMKGRDLYEQGGDFPAHAYLGESAGAKKGYMVDENAK